jgi:hypothetical protein
MTNLIRGEMGHNLVTKEVEVHPIRCTSALRTPKKVAVELPRSLDTVHREGKMKRRKRVLRGVHNRNPQK